MIPTRTSRPFGRLSPRVSDTDLAKLIDRTIQMRVDAKREQGFAATNIGCDGRKRTTMFDGSACQTDGEVCIATRQDGISACIEAPTQGLGLTSGVVVFSAPVCAPLSGVWVVIDSESNVYLLPPALVTAAPYWPMDSTYYVPYAGLVPAGKWSAVMCDAASALVVHDDGGSVLDFWDGPESAFRVWYQQIVAAIGGTSGYFADPIDRGLYLRDNESPNVGNRTATITLPASTSGVTTGSVTVGYGWAHAFNYRFLVEPTGPLNPYAFQRVFADTGTRPRLGVEYAAGHINLGGADIAEPDDCVSIVSGSSMTETNIEDATANLVGTPSGEVILFRSMYLGAGERYRLRAAPTTAPTVAVTQESFSWGSDLNLWTYGGPTALEYGVSWVGGEESFTGPAFLYGRDLPCVVWQRHGGDTDWWTDPNLRYATMSGTSGGVTMLTGISDGGTLPALTDNGYVTILAATPRIYYGWTFTDANGIESALSPLSTVIRPAVSTYAMTYTLTVTVPLGPAGTTSRRVYRFAYDYRSPLLHYSAQSPYVPDLTPPADQYTDLYAGAVYDRMCKLVATISGNVAATVVDTDTSLAYTGTRPPNPFIGPIGTVSLPAARYTTASTLLP